MEAVWISDFLKKFQGFNIIDYDDDYDNDMRCDLNIILL